MFGANEFGAVPFGAVPDEESGSSSDSDTSAIGKYKPHHDRAVRMIQMALRMVAKGRPA